MEYDSLPKNLAGRFEDIISKYELDEIRNSLEQNVEACLDIRLEAEKNYRWTGNSRIAGYPDLTPGMAWPCDGDEYYSSI